MLLDQKLANQLVQEAGTDPYLARSLAEFIENCETLNQTGFDRKREVVETHRREAEEKGGQALIDYGCAVRELVEEGVRLAFYGMLRPNSFDFSKVRAAAEYACRLPDWVFQGKLGNPFDADLWTADIAVHLSVLFDACRGLWTAEERKMIEESVCRKGIFPIYQEWVSPDTHRHALDSMGHNWWSVIVAGGCAAIALLDGACPGGEALLSEMRDGLREWFCYPGNVLQNKHGNFGDGDYLEFLGYLSYALSNAVIYERCSGEQLFPENWLEGLADFYMTHFQVLKEGVRLVNFGDSPFRMKNLSCFLLNLAGRFGRSDLLSFLTRMCGLLKTPYDFCFYPQGLLQSASGAVQAPRFAVFSHAGYAVVRSGYGEEDWLFAMKTGEGWNHNHRDAGTFLLTAKGEQIVVDSGTCSYSAPQYPEYFVMPEAHNVVLFNGRGQHPDAGYCGTKFPGSFPSSLDAGEFCYLLADCCGPYAEIFERFYRHVLLLDGAVLLLDDLYAYEDGELSWLLHPAGDFSQTGEGFLLGSGSEAVRLCCLFPEEEAGILTGYHAEEKAAVPGGMIPESRYLRLNSRTMERRAKLGHALLLPYPQNEGARIQTEDDGTVITITLSRREKRERIWLNRDADGRVMHKNSNVTCGELQTDAFLAYARENAQGVLTAAGMINGSFLRLDEKFLASSLLKQDLVVELDRRELTARVSADTRLTLSDGERRRRLILQKGLNRQKEW